MNTQAESMRHIKSKLISFNKFYYFTFYVTGSWGSRELICKVTPWRQKSPQLTEYICSRVKRLSGNLYIYTVYKNTVTSFFKFFLNRKKFNFLFRHVDDLCRKIMKTPLILHNSKSKNNNNISISLGWFVVQYFLT